MGSLIAKDATLFTGWNEDGQNHSQSLFQSLQISEKDLEEIFVCNGKSSREKLMIRKEKDVQLEPDFKNIIHHCCREKEEDKKICQSALSATLDNVYQNRSAFN